MKLSSGRASFHRNVCNVFRQSGLDLGDKCCEFCRRTFRNQSDTTIREVFDGTDDLKVSGKPLRCISKPYALDMA